MIADADALRPTHVPQDLRHREGKINQLASALRPITDGQPGENVMIFGPSGAGKTTIAKHVTSHLQGQALGVRIGYVNCISDSTKTGALHALLRDMNLGADLRPEGTAASAFIDRLRDEDRQIVAIIDEVDILDDHTLLHALHDIPNVSMVTICVNEDALFADLDPRVGSRLRSAGKIALEKYSHDELGDILWSRIEYGVRANRVGDGAVDRMADIAAGDARRGIALLRRGAYYVQENGLQTLTPAVVDSVADDAERDLIERIEAQLSTHHRLLYHIIKDAGRLGAGELHSRYESRAQDPKVKSTRRKALAVLKRYGMIGSEGSTSDCEYFCQSIPTQS